MHNQIFHKLSKSKFRSSFKLSEEDKKFVEEKGIDKIRSDVFEIISKRIKVMKENDGRQTPYRGHPVFIGMHATAICCRKCLFKWYGVDMNKELSEDEIKYFFDLIVEWILMQRNNHLAI